MARGMSVSSLPVPLQLAHRLRKTLITGVEIANLTLKAGCAPLCARRLNLAESSVSNAIAGRSDSYFIIRELYNILLSLPASQDSGVRAFIEHIAPPSIVNGLEQLAEAESELISTRLLLEVQDLLLSRPPVEQQVRALAANTDRVLADYRLLTGDSAS